MNSAGKVKINPPATTLWEKWKGKPADAVEMSNQDFALWKNAGKRTPSNKVTDPATGKSYSYDAANQQFYEFDKTQPNQRGAVVPNKEGWLFSSENKKMLDRLNKGDLIDRRRQDRTAQNSPLLPFDVGPYEQNTNINGKVYPKLPKAQGAWTANNDHIPSGESLNKRNPMFAAPTPAYKEGATIAVDDPNMHKHYSPTYGGRQNTQDSDTGGGSNSRINLDVNRPAAAFHRDTFSMLDKTQNQNYSPNHPNLDLTQHNNRLRQMGAYRTLYRHNTRLNQQLGNTRGVDPNDPGRTYIEAPNPHVGSFTYTTRPLC